MSLQGIFDPIVNAHYKKKYGGGGGGGGGEGGTEALDTLVKALMERTPYELKSNAEGVIAETAFDGNAYITSVDLPSVTSVGPNAFPRCNNLTSVNLPSATDIGRGAFYLSKALTRVNLPKATTLGDICFDGCENLVDLMIENAETIGEHAFAGCISLRSVYLPNVNTLGDYAFMDCESLEHLVLYDGVRSHSVRLTIGVQAFTKCTSLAKVDIDRMVTIDENAFSRCANLTALILRYNGVCSINLFSLDGTPAMEGAGHIYVPSGVYENYRTVYEPQIDQLVPGFFSILFRKIEDYPEICGAN